MCTHMNCHVYLFDFDYLENSGLYTEGLNRLSTPNIWISSKQHNFEIKLGKLGNSSDYIN